MRSQFIEQHRAEHHIPILATLAALDVNHHALAIDVTDLQAGQLRIADSGGVEGHEQRAMEGTAGCVDKLRHLFLAENRGQPVSLLGIGSVSNAPRLLERLDVEKT